MAHAFPIGTVVHHEEHTAVKGTIVRQLDSSEVDEDMDPGEPWYQINWGTFLGHEPEASLIKDE